jgi:hypothetical protein
MALYGPDAGPRFWPNPNIRLHEDELRGIRELGPMAVVRDELLLYRLGAETRYEALRALFPDWLPNVLFGRVSGFDDPATKRRFACVAFLELILLSMYELQGLPNRIRPTILSAAGAEGPSDSVRNVLHPFSRYVKFLGQVKSCALQALGEYIPSWAERNEIVDPERKLVPDDQMYHGSPEDEDQLFSDTIVCYNAMHRGGWLGPLERSRPNVVEMLCEWERFESIEADVKDALGGIRDLSDMVRANFFIPVFRQGKVGEFHAAALVAYNRAVRMATGETVKRGGPDGNDEDEADTSRGGGKRQTTGSFRSD